MKTPLCIAKLVVVISTLLFILTKPLEARQGPMPPIGCHYRRLFGFAPCEPPP
ncbi:hypothetical protein ERO13_A05G297050v2 [Gossypium hirsutum]|uniref:Uncharacterized protein n=3 Tax=Gossypium TaxID=3633 RepID=A0A5D2ZF63_GOSMU|nr:hypothetical protein ERO13_A05G297050v2 [Gossypium hirsutum]TYH19113.1 hypothetical protein ES288_A05G326900v1 [Gossypium darwinii]TYI29593.1 hypothetical protein ES332_A05G327300v1 [Gossypium tomentosum]TYJ36630.1 hypothetical protein E1A91_A05G320000v1 [Gossypium mustelinum]